MHLQFLPVDQSACCTHVIGLSILVVVVPLSLPPVLRLGTVLVKVGWHDRTSDTDLICERFSIDDDLIVEVARHNCLEVVLVFLFIHNLLGCAWRKLL